MNNDARSDNAFERDMPGTNARTQAEAAIEELRQRGGIFVEAVHATRMPMALTDPNLPGNPIVFANEAFLKLSGYRMEELLGQQPHFMNGSGTDPKDAARFAEVIRSDQDDIIETVQYRKDGSCFVATVLISAFKDDQGRVLNHFMSWLDVTRRVNAERDVADLRSAQKALRDSEQHLEWELRHATLLRDLAARLVPEDSLHAIYEEILSAAIEITSARAGTVQMLDDESHEPVLLAARGFSESTMEFFRRVGASASTPCGLALLRGERSYISFDQDSDDESARLHVEDGVLSAQSTPLLSRSGKPIGMVSTHWSEPDRRLSESELRFIDLLARQAADLIEQRRAEAALRESEEQLRLIVDSALDYAIFTMDLDKRITGWLPGAQHVFGWTPEEIVGQPVDITFTPEDRAKNEPNKEVEEARRIGSAPNVRWHVRNDGCRVFIDGHVVALRNEQGEVDGFLKIGQDTTEKHRIREHERMLVAELQHRVRNTLAVIRSIVRRTANTADSVEQFEQNLDGRLSSFARTQAYVTRDIEGSMDLEMIVRDELLAHAVGDSEQVSIEGPPVRLTPKQAETISLAMHELASNAMKHGALAGEGNRVDVQWSLEGDGEERRLQLSWIETLNDRTLQTPQRSGFGTELLEKVMSYELDAQPEIEFKPNGLSYRVVIPLSPSATSR